MTESRPETREKASRIGLSLLQRCPWLPIGLSLGTSLRAGIWVTDSGRVTSSRAEKTPEVTVVMGVGAVLFGLESSQKQEVPLSGAWGCAECEAGPSPSLGEG